MDRVLAWLSQCIKANERDKGARRRIEASRSVMLRFPRITSCFNRRGSAQISRPRRQTEKLVDARLKDLVPLRHNWRHDWAADDTLARRPAVSNENGRVSTRPSA